LKYAIVTPYFKESTAQLQRCIDSVRAQSLDTEHILVADGFAQNWIDHQAVRHIKLDRAHGDFGNTPRGMGAMLAIGEQFDGFGFLDADNWLQPNHVQACMQAFESASLGGKVDYVVARRYLRRLDQTVLAVGRENNSEFIDTNCFFFLPASYFLVPYFGTMPKELAPQCDRVFSATFNARGMRPGHCAEVTVNYECLWESIYRAAGEAPPPGAKPDIDSAPIQAWINSLSVEQVNTAQRLCGAVM
jgi:hypothetical protein